MDICIQHSLSSPLICWDAGTNQIAFFMNSDVHEVIFGHLTLTRIAGVVYDRQNFDQV